MIGFFALIVVSATEAHTYRASYQDPHLGQGEVTLAVRESEIIWVSFESTANHLHVTMAPSRPSFKIIASQTLAARSVQTSSTPVSSSHQFDTREPDEAAQTALIYGIPDWSAFYESLVAYFRARPAEFRDLIATSRVRPTPQQPTSALDEPVTLKL
jgi:hypothetical protein